MNNHNRVLPLAKLEGDCLCPHHIDIDPWETCLKQCCKDGKVPLIRTSRGRTLRDTKRHELCKGHGHLVCDCHGLGWLPVGEDEARAICEDWLHERGYLLTIGNHVLITHEGVSNMDSMPIHDHDIHAAVFEAVAQVAQEVAHVS